MKKIIITLLLLLTINITYSQNKQVVVDRCISKSEIYGPTGIICSNQTKTKWFTLAPNFKLDGKRLSMSGFIVIGMGIGSMSEEDKLLFSFKDGTKLRLTSGEKDKLGNNIFFALTDFDFSILKMKEIETVRYINKNNSSSFQYAMVDEEKTYFINLFNNYYIRDVYCN